MSSAANGPASEARLAVDPRATGRPFWSAFGSVGGGLLVGVVPTAVIVPLVVVLLLVSAVKVWRHA